jgi:hypothetical protein
MSRQMGVPGLRTTVALGKELEERDMPSEAQAKDICVAVRRPAGRLWRGSFVLVMCSNTDAVGPSNSIVLGNYQEAKEKPSRKIAMIMDTIVAAPGATGRERTCFGRWPQC